MSDLNYAHTLTRCMLLSALALIAGVVLPFIPPILSFLAALVPLIWYHIVYLRPRAANGLSQAAIDSVYYYGFLITIGALGAAALDLSLNGIGEDFAEVAFQFGLGLLATGYAVWARVHLTASTKIFGEDELREIMGQQIVRSRELLINIELLSSSFESFGQTLLDKSGQFAARVEAQAQLSIDGAMQAFARGIDALSQQAQVALQELRAVVNDVTFGAERETLRNSVSSMVETVASLSAGLEQLKTSTSTGAASVGGFAGSLERVNVAAAGTAEKLVLLGQERGVLAKFSEALSAGREDAQGLGLAASVAAASVTSLSDKASDASTTIEAMGRKASNAGGKFERLDELVDGVTRAGRQIVKVNAILTDLGLGSQASGSELRSFQQKLAELSSNLGALSEALSVSAGGLRDTMLSSSEAIEVAARRTAAAIDGSGIAPSGMGTSGAHVVNLTTGVDRAATTF